MPPDSQRSRKRLQEGKIISDLLKGSTGDWEMVIGLEIHAQVSCRAKLFSGAPTTFGAEPNTQVSLVDAAMPGMLPVLNKTAVRAAVRTGLAIKAQVNKRSIFVRKNYFYPDLPFGYQISQYEEPIVGEGEIEIDLPDGTIRQIGVERLHLEQDAGKSLHDQHPTKTFIDLNRAGVPLMEIVSKPDMRSADEASAYVEKMRSILRYIETCDGNMQEGSLRVDANVSVRYPGDELGNRCEIKNLNSIKFLKLAIEYEARRQIRIIEDGGNIKQETRLFDTGRGETRTMRSKEDAHDYRYFPDPDLLPVTLEDSFIDDMKLTLPELPDERKARFVDDYGLSLYDAGVLITERETAEYFEIVATGRDAKQASNWVTSDLFGRLNKESLSISESPVSAAALGSLLDLISDDTISGRIAKDVFEEMFASSKDATTIVEEKGLKQITDTGALETIIDAVIARGTVQVEQYKFGNEKIIGWFVGQVMKESQGKANPQAVNELLKAKLAT